MQLDPTFLCLWQRPAAAAPIQSLTREFPHATVVALKRSNCNNSKKTPQKTWMMPSSLTNFGRLVNQYLLNVWEQIFCEDQFFWSSHRGSAEANLVSMRMQVQPWCLSGLRIWCGRELWYIGHRPGLDPTLLWMYVV